MPQCSSIPFSRLILSIALASVSALGCSQQKEIDPNAPFQMELNGTPFEVPMKPGAAFVDHHETALGGTPQFGIRFPTGTTMATLYPGVEIQFDPRKIEAGRDIEINDSWDCAVRVHYRPARGHRMSEAQILTYTPTGGGHGIVRFDVFDPSPNGRIAGSLQTATLYGAYEDVDDGMWVDAESPLELRLKNFTFDCTLPDYSAHVYD